MNIAGKRHVIPYKPSEIHVPVVCRGTDDEWYAREEGEVNTYREPRVSFLIDNRNCDFICEIPYTGKSMTGLQMEDFFWKKYGQSHGLIRMPPRNWYDFREPVETLQGEFRMLEFKKADWRADGSLQFCCGAKQHEKLMDHYLKYTREPALRPNFLLGSEKLDKKTKRIIAIVVRRGDMSKFRREMRLMPLKTKKLKRG